jgi:hypothetical protein
MIATTLTPKTNISRLSSKIRRTARRPRSLQVKASDVDSYGDYDVEQMSALPANPVGSNTTPNVSADEFETLYQWYLS